MPHYTAKNDQAFIDRIKFDFIAQLEHRLEVEQIKQSDLAKTLEVSDSEVSQVLNGNRNLSLKTMARYARALGMKIAVVAYDDGDPKNENGPIGSEIFSQSWEKLGRPKDTWSIDEAVVSNSGSAQISYQFFDTWSILSNWWKHYSAFSARNAGTWEQVEVQFASNTEKVENVHG